MADEPTRLFHSLVPHRDRLMMLIGFLRSHLTDSIVVVCAGPSIAEFNSILANNLELRSTAPVTVTGAQEQSQRAAALARFDSGAVSVICGSALMFETCELKRRPTWVVHYDVPRPAAEELRLLRRLNPRKFLVLLDPGERGYVDALGGEKAESKELPFDPQRVPRLRDRVIALSQRKSYPLYMSSQRGYRELISAYVNHGCRDLFDATKLPLLDVAINFGIEAPPKLPLKK